MSNAKIPSNTFKASLIISVYKNVRYLKAVLDSLKDQTEKNFEIIISEDGRSDEMRDFISTYPFENEYQHLTQEDSGWRKNLAMNRAALAARAEQLIFIDGDCVCHRRFVEQYVRHFKPGRVLTGKRVLLDKPMTEWLLADLRRIKHFQWRVLLALIRNKGMERPEEGLYFPLIRRFRRGSYIIGCNISFSKTDMLKINGFDEDYTSPGYGEDADLEWRFAGVGCEFFSMRSAAVMYHLWHKLLFVWPPVEALPPKEVEKYAIAEEKKKRHEYFCVNGMSKHINQEP